MTCFKLCNTEGYPYFVEFDLWLYQIASISFLHCNLNVIIPYEVPFFLLVSAQYKHARAYQPMDFLDHLITSWQQSIPLPPSPAARTRHRTRSAEGFSAKAAPLCDPPPVVACRCRCRCRRVPGSLAGTWGLARRSATGHGRGSPSAGGQASGIITHRPVDDDGRPRPLVPA